VHKRQARTPVLGDQRSRSAIAEGVCDEAMAVRVLPFQGNEQRARRSAARIGADAVDDRRRCTDQLAFGHMGYAVKFCGDQALLAPESTVYGILFLAVQGSAGKVLSIV
jgi:hypothetical protein